MVKKCNGGDLRIKSFQLSGNKRKNIKKTSF
ncbi:hypothetical protein CLROS_001560 [Clostridium felsineum]|uniref:Uncharacterized protein n=1 Tax=Clostridium felsineum TaxID=36839 RepID=A0A1S8LJP1_9CLOT|nr:hypothetical protein CLAUR_024250 [Clostridium felsineum]URZ04832.1 hypothetical protein CLROS_001560 [Clostridium felsineum]URZ09873.1 hypothetical protein CROST_005810 [Clostridium felsineum]URZ18218.1 hypothetical protein CLFE_042730 [Clostridium felsineum DSM 794]